MVYQKSSAIAEFDRWSHSYDRNALQGLCFGPSHDMMLDRIGDKDETVLDVGCGTGIFAERVLKQNPKAVVYGLDLSHQMLVNGLTRWRVWSDRYSIARGDSERLPFRANTFDVVACSHSFHHYPNQAGVVADMFRVLKPGGRLMIVDGYRDKLLGWLIFDCLVTWVEGEVHHCSARRFKNLLTAAGFTQLEQHRCRLPIPYLLTIGKADKKAAAMPLRRAA